MAAAAPAVAQPLRVLLIEDNPADARLTRELLRETGAAAFDVVHAKALETGLALLGEGEFAAVLVDLSLADARGLETVRRLQHSHSRIPVVVLSGLDDEQTAIEALQNGAQDYLVKGQGDGHLIARAIRYAIERKRGELLLTEAKDEAEAANRAKTVFLAHMSHELRTPLNAIIGFSDLIASDALNARQPEIYREYAGYINNSGQHLLSLVNDVLDLSKSAADHLCLNEDSVALRGVLDDCLELVAVAAARQRVALSTDLPPELPPLYADRTRLKQIVLNLVSNAVKFSHKGDTVGIAVRLDAAGDLVISVADQGIGMRPEEIPIALEPFHQLDHGATRSHEGTGLGLPLSKMLAEAHGGRLAIASTFGAGTTVSVTLPESRLLWPAAADRQRAIA